MKLYRQSILFTSLIYLTLKTMSFGQEIHSEWIDVRGMSNQQIETLMGDEINGLKTYAPEVLEKAMTEMTEENDERKIKFNNTKINLRSGLNIAIDKKNDLSIEVNDLNDDLNLRSSELGALEQKIINTDSSSNMSTQLIAAEKSRVEDELTKIPFYEVMIARVKDFPEDDNGEDYDEKMGYEISRMAIENQLGLKIINETVVIDNTLSKDRVNILLQGKVNENLTLVLANRIDQKTQEVKFDRYRYGMVTVYPFQEKDVDLTLTRAMKNINCDVEIIKDVNQGLTIALSDIEKRRARSMLSEAKGKNADSESQVKRLARTSKRLLDQENRKIDRNKKTVDDINSQIKILKPEIADTDANLIKTEKDLTSAIQEFNRSKEKYDSHVFDESYVEVYPGEGYTSANESITEKYIEFGIDSFQEFLSSIRSEYIKEETELIGNEFSEIKESKKTNVVINGIRFLGKFANAKGRRLQLSIYIAYKYGFEFEKPKKPIISSIDTISSSTDNLTSKNKKWSPSKLFNDRASKVIKKKKKPVQLKTESASIDIVVKHEDDVDLKNTNLQSEIIPEQKTTLVELVPIYRFYHMENKDHFYTKNSHPKGDWKAQGIEFYAYSFKYEGTVPIYRFYHKKNKDHFYTKNSNPKGKWKAQGIEFWAYPEQY